MYTLAGMYYWIPLHGTGPLSWEQDAAERETATKMTNQTGFVFIGCMESYTQLAKQAKIFLDRFMMDGGIPLSVMTSRLDSRWFSSNEGCLHQRAAGH